MGQFNGGCSAAHSSGDSRSWRRSSKTTFAPSFKRCRWYLPRTAVKGLAELQVPGGRATRRLASRPLQYVVTQRWSPPKPEAC